MKVHVYWCVFCGVAVADLLLWKNKKTTSLVALAIWTLTYYFLISSLTLLSLVSKLCFVLTAAVYIQNFLPASVYGKFLLMSLNSSLFPRINLIWILNEIINQVWCSKAEISLLSIWSTWRHCEYGYPVITKSVECCLGQFGECSGETQSCFLCQGANFFLVKVFEGMLSE